VAAVNVPDPSEGASPPAAIKDWPAPWSLYEVARPDSLETMRPGASGPVPDARLRLQRRRERLLTELKSVEAAIAENKETPATAWQPAKDYSYLAKSAGRYTDDLPAGPPMNALKLGIANFKREFRELVFTITGKEVADSKPVDFYDSFEDVLAESQVLAESDMGLKMPGDGAPEYVDWQTQSVRNQLKQLTLSNAKVWEREERREQIRSPFILKGPYLLLCVMIDVVFENKPIERFWFLENVARMPYLSYVSMLHLYESLGWWRRGARVKQIHFAEEWNEFHHLLIMESLGGDQKWFTRFFAQHASIAYYLTLCFLWVLSPTVAYNFSELIEAHAVDSYDQFLDENSKALKKIPAPPIAYTYYMAEDLYKYDEFQSEREPGSRRIRIENLYDVFEAISGDEAEHVKTMAACQRKEMLPAAADAERIIFFTTAFTYLTDLALRTLAEFSAASDMEVPEAFEGIARFAQQYAEAGGLEALLQEIIKIIPFIG